MEVSIREFEPADYEHLVELGTATAG